MLVFEEDIGKPKMQTEIQYFYNNKVLDKTINEYKENINYSILIDKEQDEKNIEKYRSKVYMMDIIRNMF
jgi:hypothetical protein